MKNITLSADEGLIEAARERARSEHTTLNEQFRRWLTEYTESTGRFDRTIRTIENLRKAVRTGGRRFSRDEMDER